MVVSFSPYWVVWLGVTTILTVGDIDRSGKLVIPLKFSKPYEDKIENEEHWFKNGKAKVMDFKKQTFCINKLNRPGIVGDLKL